METSNVVTLKDFNVLWMHVENGVSANTAEGQQINDSAWWCALLLHDA